MIVVRPDIIIFVQVWKEFLGKPGVNLFVKPASRPVELNFALKAVKERPEASVAESIVVGVDFAIGEIETDDAIVVGLPGHRFSFPARAGFSAPPEPDSAAGLPRNSFHT